MDGNLEVTPGFKRVRRSDGSTFKDAEVELSEMTDRLIKIGEDLEWLKDTSWMCLELNAKNVSKIFEHLDDMQKSRQKALEIFVKGATG